MSRAREESETCEGREGGERPDAEPAIAVPVPRKEPVVRLWTVWDHYQSALIEGLAQPEA